MSNAISSLGVKVYALGTKPTQLSELVESALIPEITEVPDFDFEPDNIETTSLDNTKYKTYIEGLRDTGGILSFTANYTKAGVDKWDTFAESDGFIAIRVPKANGTSDKAWVIPANFIATGVPTIAVNDVIRIAYKFTVTGDITSI